MSGSGRRKPKQVQVTPAEFQDGIYCGRLRLAAEPAIRNFLRSYTVRANCKRYYVYARGTSVPLTETNIAFFFISTTLCIPHGTKITTPEDTASSHLMSFGESPSPAPLQLLNGRCHSGELENNKEFSANCLKVICLFWIINNYCFICGRMTESCLEWSQIGGPSRVCSRINFANKCPLHGWKDRPKRLGHKPSHLEGQSSNWGEGY